MAYIIDMMGYMSVDRYQWVSYFLLTIVSVAYIIDMKGYMSVDRYQWVSYFLLTSCLTASIVENNNIYIYIQNRDI